MTALTCTRCGVSYPPLPEDPPDRPYCDPCTDEIAARLNVIGWRMRAIATAQEGER